MKLQFNLLNVERYKPSFSFMIGVFVWGNNEFSFLGFINEGNTKYIDILFFRVKL